MARKHGWQLPAHTLQVRPPLPSLLPLRVPGSAQPGQSTGLYSGPSPRSRRCVVGSRRNSLRDSVPVSSRRWEFSGRRSVGGREPAWRWLVSLILPFPPLFFWCVCLPVWRRMGNMSSRGVESGREGLRNGSGIWRILPPVLDLVMFVELSRVVRRFGLVLTCLLC
jgi:hypothetical protein